MDGDFAKIRGRNESLQGNSARVFSDFRAGEMKNLISGGGKESVALFLVSTLALVPVMEIMPIQFHADDPPNPVQAKGKIHPVRTRLPLTDNLQIAVRVIKCPHRV